MLHPQFNQCVLASGNPHKLTEIQAILTDLDCQLILQSTLHIAPIAETGLTFVENALLKARHAAHHSGLPALADDSGLVVDALNGAPGIYSARYAGTNATSEQCNAKLLSALENVPKDQRTAHYYCVIVLLTSATDPEPIICQGRWSGAIAFTARGTHGFGYDPIFYLPEHDYQVGQLDPNIKNQISHRAQALQQLRQQWERLC
ncbi:MAG: RdgB/HAM1 family non-canonical purine NTP pyrophosphatase [Legionellales bacterium]|nr:RdgB/HAM1 family non-canonical purine NTP pyrophosphatase [Legionellales bacterium]